jgi:hypothetical protein
MKLLGGVNRNLARASPSAQSSDKTTEHVMQSEMAPLPQFPFYRFVLPPSLLYL